MKNKIIGLAVILMSFASADAQQLTVKRAKNIKVVKSWTINMSDLDPIQPDLVKVYDVAPKPHMEYGALKQQLDNARKRKKAAFSKTTGIVTTSEEVKPIISSDFNGKAFGGGGTPNDNNMAISNNGTIISAINSNVNIMDKDGNSLLYRTLRGLVFGQLPNLNRTFDPKLVYDPIADRFILVFLQGSTSADTRIVVGFTQTADPTQDWQFYAIDGNPFKENTWSDYPIIGISEDELFITVNILTDGMSWQEGFTQSVIWQIETEDGYAGKPELTNELYHDIKYNGKSVWSICAIPGGMKPQERGMYFLSVRPSTSSNDTLFLHHIDNNIASNKAEISLKVLQADKPYGVPPSAFQPEVGFRLQTNDTRVLDGFIQGNTIQYVQSSIIPSNGVPGVFHGVIDDINGTSVRANYIYQDSLDIAYPSIAFTGTNANNPYPSAITFSHSSEWEYPGTSISYHNADADLGPLYSSIVHVRKGDSLINSFLPDSIERWGDYTAIQRKYNEENTVWLCGSYGESDGNSGTWIAEVALNNNLVVIKDANLFPNPAGNRVNVNFNSEKTEKIKVQLVNIIGAQITEIGEYDVTKGIYELSFDVSDITAGTYSVNIYSESNEPLFCEKIVVARD